MPDTASGLATAEAALVDLAQTAGSAPPPATQDDVAVLADQLLALQVQPPARQYNNPRYGEFYSTVAQTAAAINTAYAVTFNATFITFGASIASSSRLIVDRPGLYMVQWGVHPDNSSGTAANMWSWLRKNGTDIPYTLTHSTISGSHAQAQSSGRYLVDLCPTDYLEVYWATDNTSISLGVDAATAFYPAGASATVSITDNVSSLESRP
jgi:hypothetical protein